MRRTLVRFRQRLAAFALAVLVLAIAPSWLLRPVAAGEGSMASTRSPERVVVRPGDTLWSIAVRLAGPSEDPRPVVDELAARNALVDATIFPGQSLTVP